MRKRIYGCKSKCKSQFCEDCALAHCVSWREKLRPALRDWKSVLMLTLTLDQKPFDGPEEAYRYIGKKRAVAELMKKLHKGQHVITRRYALAMEYHKNGWPHYHVLVEGRYVDKHKLQKMWGHGIAYVSKHDFKNVEHAINYATKYISKTDEKGGFWFPDWVLDYKGNIRRFSTSRGLVPTRKQKKKCSNKARARVTKTGRQRSKLCGETTTVLMKHHKAVVGEVEGVKTVFVEEQSTYLGTLEIPWAEGKELRHWDLIRLLRIQEWNQEQYPVEETFGGLSVERWEQKQQPIRSYRISQHAPSKNR